MDEKKKICPFCGEEILAIAKKCKYCGEFFETEKEITVEQEGYSPIAAMEKISQQNINIPKLDRFNWGAFLLNWIWGIGNKAYIPVWVTGILVILFAVFILWELIVVLFFDLTDTIIAIMWVLYGILVTAAFCFTVWFGVEGNKWAWLNKKWNSIEQFEQTQRKWAMWGGIVWGSVVFICLFFMIFILTGILFETLGI